MSRLPAARKLTSMAKIFWTDQAQSFYLFLADQAVAFPGNVTGSGSISHSKLVNLSWVSLSTAHWLKLICWGCCCLFQQMTTTCLRARSQQLRPSHQVSQALDIWSLQSSWEIIDRRLVPASACHARRKTRDSQSSSANVQWVRWRRNLESFTIKYHEYPLVSVCVSVFPIDFLPLFEILYEEKKGGSARFSGRPMENIPWFASCLAQIGCPNCPTHQSRLMTQNLRQKCWSCWVLCDRKAGFSEAIIEHFQTWSVSRHPDEPTCPAEGDSCNC